ncbi:MAG: hypothetical protein ACLTKI_05010 [Lachnospiraceae bacterium]
MKQLLQAADQFIQESDWKTIAVLKFCLISMGIMWGIAIPKRHKGKAAFVCSAVFTVTYIPLILKFLRIYERDTM